MTIKIKNRFTGEIIIEGDYKDLKDVVEKNKANLSEADLSEANLSEANLVEFIKVANMKTHLPTNDILARQRFWLKHYLEPYRLGNSIAFWQENPELYEKITSIKNRIIRALILDEDNKQIIMTEYELMDRGGFSMLRRKQEDWKGLAAGLTMMIILVIAIWIGI